jgi:L-ascorbate metabolism protein UlaG (beta-lactamase superfamily)
VTVLVPEHDAFTIEDKLSYEGIDIEAYLTPHTELHRSYLVTWHGIRIYFVGDTEDAGKLLAMKDIDVAFITPWLLRAVAENGGTIDARRIVVYHHRFGEKVTAHQDRVVPKQGDTFTIPFVASSE